MKLYDEIQGRIEHMERWESLSENEKVAIREHCRQFASPDGMLDCIVRQYCEQRREVEKLDPLGRVIF
jgi:hypothetical protein